MARKQAVVGLMALALLVAVPVLLQGQKAARPPSPTQQTEIPLKVTVFGWDNFGNPTALRGHPGTGDVVYADGTRGIDAHLTKEGNLWFHIDCRYGNHIDLDFAPERLLVTGDDGTAPFTEGDMQTFRMMTWVPDDQMSFGEMLPGVTYSNYPVGVQFWTAVDQYAWNLQYDALPKRSGIYPHSVDVTVGLAAGKKTWAITPTSTPRNIPEYAAAVFEKYYHRRPDPGDFYQYGTWVMPFKVVLEQLK